MEADPLAGIHAETTGSDCGPAARPGCNRRRGAEGRARGVLAAVTATADAPRLEAFRQGLRELGYVEGQNLVIEYRHEGGGFGRLPELAAELVRQKPDVLVAVTTNAALAMRRSTTTIPIVFMGVTDPVTAGLVESLSRPGGNTTGITNIAAILTGSA